MLTFGLEELRKSCTKIVYRVGSTTKPLGTPAEVLLTEGLASGKRMKKSRFARNDAKMCIRGA